MVKRRNSLKLTCCVAWHAWNAEDGMCAMVVDTVLYHPVFNNVDNSTYIFRLHLVAHITVSSYSWMLE